MTNIIPSLKLAQQLHPHSPIGVVSFNNEILSERLSGLTNLAKENELTLSWKNGAGVISKKKNEEINSQSFFSGIAFYEGNLIFGEDDVAFSSGLNDAYGEFSLLKIHQDNFEFSSDHFGYGKWFYYKDNSIFCAATSYHLLLLMLVACGIRLEMNIERSRVNLSQIGFGFTFGQQFSREMDVKDVFVKMANENLIFYPQEHRISLEKTKLLDLISTPSPWDEDEYEECLRKGRDEICENLRAVFESPHFDQVVIDLSGGFDSRVVYAAMTTLPKNLREKAKVYIRNSHVSDDVQIAHSVNNCYGHQVINSFDNDVSSIFDEVGRVNLHNLSVQLGSYSQLASMKKFDANPRYIEIMGGGGDILFGYNRIYGDYAKLFAQYPEDASIIRKIAADGMHSLQQSCPSVVADAENILAGMLSEFPDSLHLYQRLHVMYLLFRNNNHFTAYRYQNNFLTLNVLQSKWALKAKWMFWGRYGRNQIPPEKISIDMLNLMNPLLAKIPFARENDSFLPNNEELAQPTRVTIEVENAIQPYKFINQKSSSKTYSQKAKEFIQDLENSRSLLDTIESYHPAYAEVVSKLRALLEKEGLEPAKSFPYRLVNNIFNVGYEIKIVQESRNNL